jgi:ATP-dependent RNA helicase DDX19/DBP5
MDNLDASKEEPIPVKPTALLESKHDVEIELADDSDRAKLLSATTFEAIISNPDILKGVYAMGYQKPSKIQGTAVPLLFSTPYKNFIGQSQSGSGKTGAFSLTILSRIDKSIGQTQALVLAPTRELANQIIGVIKQMSQFSGISSVLAVKDSVPRGGTLSDHIVVGTPGTVQDLLRRKAILADQIRIFVIDEADVCVT